MNKYAIGALLGGAALVIAPILMFVALIFVAGMRDIVIRGIPNGLCEVADVCCVGCSRDWFRRPRPEDYHVTRKTPDPQRGRICEETLAQIRNVSDYCSARSACECNDVGFIWQRGPQPFSDGHDWLVLQ